MIRFKIDVAAALKAAGYTSYQAKKNAYLNPATYNNICKGDASISAETIGKICNLTGLQPGDFLEWIHTEEELERAAKVKKGPRKKRTTRKAEEPGE